ANGSFELDRVKPPDAVGFDAPGYRPQSLRVVNPLEALASRLEPIGVEIDAVDADTGQPVTAVMDGLTSASTIAAGRIRVAPVRDRQKFNLTAAGYIGAEAVYTGQDVLRVPMQLRLDGRVVDAATGKPVSGARMALGDVVLTSGSDGSFTLLGRPAQGVLTVLAPGYRRGT